MAVKAVTMKSPNSRRRAARWLAGASPAEAMMGRLLRAPDDHGAAPVADAPPAADAAPAAAPAGDAAPADGGADGATALGGGAKEADPAPDGEAAATAAAAADAAPAADEGPPETYDLSVEGVALDAEMVTAAEPVLRELGLSNDKAKQLVPIAAQLVESSTAAGAEFAVNEIVSRGNEQRKAWLDAAKGAEDIGGGNWDASLHIAAKGLDAMGFTLRDAASGSEAHPFRAALEATGFGNHPDMIRTFRRLGELLGEDGDFVRGDGSATARSSATKRLYPND